MRSGIRTIRENNTELLRKSDQTSVYTGEQMEEEILTPFWEKDANLWLRWSNPRWDKLFRATILRQVLPQLDESISMGEDAEMNLRVLPLCKKIVTLAGSCFYKFSEIAIL